MVIFDPYFTDTVAGVISSVLAFAEKLPLPPHIKFWLGLVLGLLATIKILGKLRNLRIKFGPTPPPITDGQTADDLANPPAREGGGEAGGGSTGGMG